MGWCLGWRIIQIVEVARVLKYLVGSPKQLVPLQPTPTAIEVDANPCSEQNGVPRIIPIVHPPPASPKVGLQLLASDLPVGFVMLERDGVNRTVTSVEPNSHLLLKLMEVGV